MKKFERKKLFSWQSGSPPLFKTGWLALLMTFCMFGIGEKANAQCEAGGNVTFTVTSITFPLVDDGAGSEAEWVVEIDGNAYYFDLPEGGGTFTVAQLMADLNPGGDGCANSFSPTFTGVVGTGVPIAAHENDSFAANDCTQDGGDDDFGTGNIVVAPGGMSGSTSASTSGGVTINYDFSCVAEGGDDPCEDLVVNNTPGCTDDPPYDTAVPLEDGAIATDVSQMGEICATFEKIDDAGAGCAACQQLGGVGHNPGGNPFNSEIQVQLVNTCTGTTVDLIPGGTFGGDYAGVVTYCMTAAMAGTAVPGAGGTPTGGSFDYDATGLVGEVLQDDAMGCGTVVRVLDSAAGDPLCVGAADGSGGVTVTGFCAALPEACAKAGDIALSDPVICAGGTTTFSIGESEFPEFDGAGSDGDATTGTYVVDFYTGLCPSPTNECGFNYGNPGDLGTLQIPATPNVDWNGLVGAIQMNYDAEAGQVEIDIPFGNTLVIPVAPSNTQICMVGSVTDELLTSVDPTMETCVDNSNQVCFYLLDPITYDAAETYACTGTFVNDDDELMLVTMGTFAGGMETLDGEPLTVCGATGLYFADDADGDGSPDAVDITGDGVVDFADLNQMQPDFATALPASGIVLLALSNQPWSLTVCDQEGCEYTVNGGYNFFEPNITMPSFACSTSDPIVGFFGVNGASNVGSFPPASVTETANANAVPGVTVDLANGTFTFDPAAFVAANGGGGQAFIDYTITDATTGCSRTTLQAVSVADCAPECSSIVLDLSLQEDDVCDGQVTDLSMALTPDMTALFDADGDGTIDAGFEACFVFGVAGVPDIFTNDPYNPLIPITEFPAVAGFGPAGQNAVFTNATFTHSGTSCNPEEYIVYAYINTACQAPGGPIPDSCFPWVAEVITVYPDPANLTVVASSAGECLLELVAFDAASGTLCPDYTVFPSVIEADFDGDLAAAIFAPDDAFSNAGSCPPAQVIVPIVGAANAAWTSPGPLCVSDTPFDLNATVTGDAGGTWSGDGVDAAGMFMPTATADGQITSSVTYCVESAGLDDFGDAVDCITCETHAIDVYPAVDATVTADGIACSSSNCFDLEQQIVSGTTTLGGIWVANAATPLPAEISLAGTNLCYDPATITAPVTAVVDYSVASYSAATGTCIGIGTTTITILPQAEIDIDLPSAFCVDNAGSTHDLTAYLTSAAELANLSAVGDGTWTLDGVDITATAAAQDFTANVGTNVEICYTEETVENSDCGLTDCDIVNIYLLDATLADATVCSSSTFCVDLESMFTATTTQGGVFTTTSTDGTISGTNFCYDKENLPITATITYDVTSQDGVCTSTATADVTIVEGVTAFLDLPAEMCSDEDLCDLMNYVSVVDAAGNNVANGIAGTFTVEAYNVDGSFVNVDPLADPIATIAGLCLSPDDKFEGFLTIRYMDANGDCMTIAQDNIQVSRGGTADFKNPSPVCAGDGAFNLSDLTTAAAPYPYTGMGTACGVFEVINEDGTASADLVVTCVPSATPGFPDECMYMWDPVNAGGTAVTIRYTVGAGDCQDVVEMLVPVCESVSAAFTGDIDVCENNNKVWCATDYFATGTTMPFETKVETVTDMAIYAIDTVDNYVDVNNDDLVDTISVIIYDTVYTDVQIATTCQNGFFDYGPGLTVVDEEAACVTVDAGFSGQTWISYTVGKNLDYNCDGAPDGGFDCSTSDLTSCLDKDTLFLNIEDVKLDPTFDLVAEVCASEGTLIDGLDDEVGDIGLDLIEFTQTGPEDLDQILTGTTFDISTDGDSLNCSFAFIPDDLIDRVLVPEDTICGPGFLKDMTITLTYRASTGADCEDAQGDHDGFNVVGPGGVLIYESGDDSVIGTTPNGFPVDDATVVDSNDDFFTVVVGFDAIVGEYAANGLDLNEVMATNCDMDLVFVYTLITNAARTNIDLTVDFDWAVVKSDFSIAVCDPAGLASPLATLDGFDNDEFAFDSGLFYYGIDSVACTDSLVFNLEALMAAYAPDGDCPLKLIVTNEAEACDGCIPTYCDTLTIFPEPEANLVCDYTAEVCAGETLDLSTLLDGSNGGSFFLMDGTPIGVGVATTTTEIVVVPESSYTDENGNIVFVDEQVYEEEVTTVEGAYEWVAPEMCGAMSIVYVQDAVVCNGETVAIVPPCAGNSDTTIVWISTPNPEELFTSTASPYVCGDEILTITPQTCGGDLTITLVDSQEYEIYPNTDPAFGGGVTIDVTTVPEVLAEGCTASVTTVNSITIDPSLFDETVNLDGLWYLEASATNSCGTSEYTEAVYFIEEADATIAAVTICETPTYDLTGMFLGTTTPGGSFLVDGTPIGNELVGFGPGSYTITYTVAEESDCFATATATLTILNTPDITGVAVPPSVCAGTDFTVTVSGDLVDAVTTVMVNGVAGVSADGMNFTVTAGADWDGLYQVAVVAAHPSGCSDEELVEVYVIQNAIADLDPAGITVCEGTAVELEDLIMAGSTPGGAFDLDVTDLGPGSYAVNYSVGVEGQCSATGSSTVTVVTAPDASFTAATLNACDGEAIALTVTGDMGGVWSSTGDGVVADGSFTGTNGLYEVCYTVAGTDPCPDDVVCVSINVTPGATAGTGGSTTVCDGESVNLTTLLDGAANTGGQFTDASGAAVGNMVAPGVGTNVYTYTVAADVDGQCDASTTVTVVIVAQPDASFTTNASPSLCANQMLEVTPTEAGGTMTLTDGSTATFMSGMVVSDIASYTGPGLYTLCYSIDNGTCSDEVCVDIQVNDAAAAEFVPDFISVCETQGTVDLTQYLQINSTTGENGAFVAINNTGWFLDGSNTVDPTGQAGNILCVDYNVELTGNSATECTDQAQICIEVTAEPTGEFTTDNVVCLQPGGFTSSIILDAAADPYGNDRGEFTVTDPNGVVSGPYVDGDGVSIGEAGTWIVSYTVGEFACITTTEQAVVVCPAIELPASVTEAYCEGSSDMISLADYLEADTPAGTWTLDDVEVTDLDVDLSGLEAGESLVYFYTVVSDCDPSCTANFSVTFRIEEIKWNPCMEGLETDYCSAAGLVDTVEYIAGSPFDTIVFSGFGVDSIPVTDGSLLPMDYPLLPGDDVNNYAGGEVGICAADGYFCGTQAELLGMTLTYNYQTTEVFQDIVNGDWDSLVIEGPGGVIIFEDAKPVNPADELFDDITITYDEVLAAYAPFGGQDFLNALVSSCDKLNFRYYLITRSAPVYIELEVFAEVRITKNQIEAYDGAGNPLPEGHFVFDDATGLTTIAMQVEDDSACGYSDLADLPQPISIANTTYDCTACGDGQTTCISEFTVHKQINTDLAASLDYCVDDNNIVDLTGLLTYTDAGCAVTTPGGYFLVTYPDGSQVPMIQDLTSDLVQGPYTIDLSQVVIDGSSVALNVQYVATETSEGSIEGDDYCPADPGMAVINVYTAPEIDFHSNSPFVCNDGTVLVDQIVTDGTVDNVFMTNSTDYQLTDNSDGTWSLPLDASFEGLYTITVQASNGTCTAEETQSVYIVGEPNAQLDPAEALTVCEGTAIELDDMLTADNTPGGYWAVTDASGNQVDVTGIAPGTYNVTYTAGAAGCEDTGSGTFTVIPAPDASFTYNGSPYLCEGDDLIANGGDGTWTLVSGNEDGTADVVIATGTGTSFTTSTTGLIDAGFSGLFTLTHSVTGENGCTDEVSRDVLVINDPDAVTGFNADVLQVCAGEGPILLPAFLNSTSTGGGVYTINGETATSNFLFTGAADAGSSFDITYSVNVPGCGDGVGSASMTVEVYAEPDASFDIGGLYCESDGAIALTAPDAPYTSTYTVNGVESTMFDPSMGAGEYTITHTVAIGDLGFSCSDSYTVTVTVDGAADAGTSTAATYCQYTSEVVDLAVLLGTADAGGVWTSPTGDVLSSSVLDLSTVSSVANVNFTYTYTVGNADLPGTACVASSNVTINFASSIDPSFSGLPAGEVCAADGNVFPLTLNQANTIVGVTSTGTATDQVAVSTTIPNTATAATTLNSGNVFNFTPGSTITDVNIYIDFQPIDLLPGARLDYFITGPGGVVIESTPAPGPFDFGSYFTDTLTLADVVAAYGSLEALEAALTCQNDPFVYTLNSNSSGFGITISVEVVYNQVLGNFSVSGPNASTDYLVANDVVNNDYAVDLSEAGTYEICFTTSECTNVGNCGGMVESCQTVEVIGGVCDYLIDEVADICGGLSTFFLESLPNSNAPDGVFSINPEAEAAGAAIYGANDMLLSLGNIDFGGAASIDVVVTYTIDNPGPCDCASDEVVITVYNDDIDATFDTNASPSICAGSTLVITPNESLGGTVTMTFANGAPVDIVDAGDGTWTFDIPTGYAGLFYVTHEVENGPCSDAVVTPIYVISDATAELAAPMTMCEDAVEAVNLLDLLAEGTPAGGVFTVTNGGVTQLIDGPFTPSVGTTTIDYAVGTGDCAAAGSTSITVYATPVLDVPASVCDAADLVVPAGASTSTDADGNIVVSITSVDGCTATATVQVIGEAVVDLPTEPVTVCEGDVLGLDQYLATSTAGGTWTGFQVETDNEGFFFDSNDLGGFITTVSYSVGTGDCAASGSMTIMVGNPATDATFFVPSPLCSDDAPFTLPAVTNIDGVALSTFYNEAGDVITEFDPSVGAGTYAITHVVPNGNCPSSTYITEVTVIEGAADAGFGVVDAAGNTVTSNLFSYCDGDASGEITLVPTTPGGNWTCANGTFGTDADGNTVFQYDLAGAPSGSFAVNYELPGSCGGTVTKVIQVFATPEPADVEQPDITCSGDEAEAVEIAGRAIDLVVFWSDAEGGDENIITQGAPGDDLSYTPGVITETTTVWVGYTNIAGCESELVAITWVVEDGGSLTGVDITQCNDNAFTMTVAGAGTTGGTYSWTQVAGTGSFLTVAPELGITVNPGSSTSYTVTYTTEGGCEGEGTTVSAENIAPISVSAEITDVNYADNTYTVVVTINGGSGDYSSNGNAVTSGFTVVGTIGTDVMVTVSDDNCGDDASVGVTSPDPFFVTDDEYTIMQGEEVTLEITINDGSGDAVIAIDTAPTNGTAAVVDGQVVYTPNPDACGAAVDMFTYTATLGGETLTATVIINIECVPDTEITIEQDCDKTTGNFEVFATIVNPIAGANYTFFAGAECGDEADATSWLEVPFEGNFASPISSGPIPSDQGAESAYCIQIAEFVDGAVTIYTFADDSVSCVKTSIELVEFDGRVEAEGNELFWTTATEYDNDYFTIERSLDGYVFEAIQNTDSRGNSNTAQFYTEMDYTAPVGIAYYRLLATNLDGDTKVVSQVVALERTEAGEFEVHVAPVPATDEINVSFNSGNVTFSTLRVVDITGALISEQRIETIEGLNKLVIDIRSYAAGSYFLTVEKDGNLATTRFIKE